MPRLTHALPKLSHHRASGQARVRYLGRDHYLGPWGSQQAKNAYAHFIASMDANSPPRQVDTPRPTQAALLVGEIVVKFLAHAVRYYRRADGEPTGEAATIKHALRPLVQAYGEELAEHFGPRKLQALRERMIGLGWTRGTINRACNRVRLCFTWAAAQELVRPDVALGLKCVAGLKAGRTAAEEKPPVSPVSVEHLDAILPHVQDLVADLIRLMRFTGARPGEVLTLAATGIDRTDPDCWRYCPAHHKSQHKGKTRVIFLGPQAQAVLRPYLVKAGDNPLFPLTLSAFRRAILRGCKAAGIPRFSPNQIRHSVATQVRAAYGLEAAQCLLGHSKADVTQIYAEKNMRLAEEIARKIG